MSSAHLNFAGRRPAGTENAVTLSKNGVYHTQRIADGTIREVIACGLACSECFSGQNLYKLLKPGLDYEQAVMEKLAAGEAAEPLSIHTSNGVPEPLEDFLKALEIHLPWENKKELDWCVSLQIEGASAVWAAIDMLLQLNMLERKGNENRLKVAVGATSYHGPPSTSFGAKTPIWAKEQQLIYPVPTAYGPYDEEVLLSKYQDFLDKYADQIGVILFEPQWGSSQAALPWPEHLLKKYVTMAKERGIKVICDEIMCGLGRHGKGTLFISQAWGLDPDAVTFGKAIATGVYQLSGAILKTGREILKANKCSVMQSHTYAGSSTRALMAATAVLKEFVTWLPNVAHLGHEMANIMKYLTKVSNGLFICHGQGLMWGGIITHFGQCEDEKFRLNVVKAFQKFCYEAKIVPYFVPVGGFMVSPVIDIDVGTIYEIGNRLEQAILKTMEEVGWSAFCPVIAEETKEDPVATHFRAPSIASASTIDLATLAKQEESKLTECISLGRDLAYDRCVPYLHATRGCTSCGKFVSTSVRTKFLDQ